MRVFVAEKRSVALLLAEALGQPMPGDDFYRSGDDVVVWAQGHLLGLAPPEHYHSSWKQWRKGDLPLLPGKIDTVPLPGGKRRVAKISKWLQKADEIINACDAGREGELIFSWILQNEKQSVQRKYRQRLWTSSLEEKALQEALQNLHPASQYKNLFQAARLRAESDWLLGINATRAASLSLGEMTSLGRVQTPTLALLADRQKEHDNFKREAFWKVRALFTADGEDFWGEHQGGRMSQADAEAIRVGREGTVLSVRSKNIREQPPLLHDLTSLQREASSRWGWTAQRTLGVAQELYEKGVLSYPRTASRYLPESMSPEEVLQHLPAFPRRDDFGRIFDDRGVGDHHAIVLVGDCELHGDLRLLGDCVGERIREAFSLDACFWREEIEIDCSGEIFVVRGRRYKEWGWRKKKDSLPLLRKGSVVSIKKSEALQSSTKPPPLYSDGTLLAAMETAGRHVEDDEAREAMKDRGLGTPATRAAIIERLLEVGYLQRQGRSLLVTRKGMHVVEVLRGRPLLRPDITGEWERDLRAVEEGADPDDFARRMRAFVTEETRELLRLDGGSWGRCPGCGETLRENRKGISCWRPDDPGCGFVLWKRVAGKTLSEHMLRDLLRQGSTKKLKGFRSARGNAFSSRLHLVQEDGKWKVVFD